MKKRVLVVSSANIDFVQNIERMPYSGETLIERNGSYSYIPGGKGANSAISFARLGADCVFVCKVGADNNGAKLRGLYRAEGIDTRFMLEDEENPTGMASILVERDGKNRIIVFPGANNNISAEELEDPFTCYPDALYLQMEIAETTVLECCRLAAERNIPIFIDAAPARGDFPLSKLGKVEIFSPNENECRIFTGISPVTEETALRAAIKLKRKVNAKYIVLKLGARGAFMFDGNEYFVYPPEPVIPVDTTAAGDVFTAVMTYSYLQNGNIHSAIRMANVAAAISITKKGASSSIPTLSEITAYRNAAIAKRESEVAEKVAAEKVAAEKAAAEKEAAEKAAAEKVAAEKAAAEKEAAEKEAAEKAAAERETAEREILAAKDALTDDAETEAVTLCKGHDNGINSIFDDIIMEADAE